MTENGTVFVGIDAAKAKHAVAVAEPGRGGEVRYIGEIDAAADAVRKLLTRLAARHGKLHVCYEAGPTGYGLYRQVIGLGHECTVVAPSLIPRKAGDRVKTNRRDTVQLARVKDIAWKAQTTLCGRYRALASRGKQLTVAVTAVARELAGFVWAVGREVKPA